MQTFKRSVRVRTLIVGAVLALALGGAFVLLIAAIQDQRSAGRAALRSQEAVTAGAELEKSLVNLDNGLRAYVASRRERSLDPFESARRAYPPEVERLTRLIADEPRQQAAVRQIEREIDDYLALWALPLLKLAGDRPAAARSVLATGAGRERVDALRLRFARLFERERAVAASRERRAERQSDRAVLLGFAGLVLVAVVAAGLWLYLRRSIIRPVLRVAHATQTVAAGDLSARVPATREDELGSLARSFNAMASSLQRSRDDLDRRTAELERSNGELERYAQVTSHDLQAPLSTVSMYTGLLERRIGDRADRQTAELLRGIATSTASMTALVRDLLQYSRVGRGTVPLTTLDAEGLLGQALENLAGPIGERGAVIESGPLPAVRGDRGQLCQVFQNLIGNAVKFSDEARPHVRVTAAREDGFCRFSVRDNGIGIDPADAERIFEPFQRLHGEKRYEGTGIGLAIAQKIVTHHGGSIWAEGRPGEGSTFHFTLPLGDGPPPRGLAPLATAGAS